MRLTAALPLIASLVLLAACILPATGTPPASSITSAATATTQAPPPGSPAADSAAMPSSTITVTIPAATPAALEQTPPLGTLAFVRDGSTWIMDVPDGEPHRIAPTDRDATLRWSASGQWLAYRHAGGLWVARSDGRDAHSVEDCPLPYVSQPWSPAADELVCVGTLGLDIVQADGSGRRQIVSRKSGGPGTGISSVVWSPDGKVLAYAREDDLKPGTPSERVASLSRINADGSGAMELLNAGTPSKDGLIAAGWSADGSYVLYRVIEGFSGSALADGTPVWAVPATGGTPVQLGANLAGDARPSRDKVLYYSDFLASPEAQGSKPGLLAATFGGYRATWTNKRVGLVDVKTGQARLLSPQDMAASSPNWSPDGRYLAYSAMPDAGDLVGGEPARQGLMGRRIYVVDAQGESTIRRLTDDPAYRDELPIWSVDGKHILFARIDEQSRASLWWMNVVTGEPRQLVDGLALDPQTSGFGYYGHIDWQMQFDSWRGSKADAATTSVPAPTPAS